MEIEMTNRKVTGGIDLTDWDLVKIDRKIEQAKEKAEKKIEAAIEELFEPFKYGGKLEYLIKEAAGEALTYSAKDRFLVSFFKGNFMAKNLKPGDMLISVSFSDFDSFEWKENIYENIKENIDGWKEEDGFTSERKEKEFLAVANEFRKCADILEKSIRPKGNK